MIGGQPNTFPQLHNAARPGVVGQGAGAEPPIDPDTMRAWSATAEVDGVRSDGVDLFLPAPPVDGGATGVQGGAVPAPAPEDLAWPRRSTSR
jgi:hypothetical protein